MPDLALLKKLNFKAGETFRLLNAPTGIEQLFLPLPDGNPSSADDRADLVLLFVATQAELASLISIAIGALNPRGHLWIAFPKKSSGIKSDLSRDNGWEILINMGYEGVTLIAIDENWSAFRMRQASEIKAPTRSAAVPRDQRPELIVPTELAAHFAESPDDILYFEKLSYTHRKEYVQWIEDAKKPETRANRVQKAIEMIRGKMTRS